MANGDDISDGARAAALLAYAQQHYGTALGTSGDDDLTDAALRGIMTSVRDPYTVYLSPRENEGLNLSLIHILSAPAPALGQTRCV